MEQTNKTLKGLIAFFIAILFLSGLTAIPLEAELDFACRLFPMGSTIGNWLDKVYMGYHTVNTTYPFLSYGYDWLAFAHFVLAILFIGPYKNPVKNKWVIEFGMLACLLIIPFALVAGHYRQIPVWWRLIDCSFGIIGIIPLAICLKKIHQIESYNTEPPLIN